MFNIQYKRSVVALAAGWLFATAAYADATMDPGPGTRYATDAFPAFDNTEMNVRPSRKEPRWFSWWNGPEKATATEQLAWCEEREAAGDISAARKGYDALVREWPIAPEAAKAQLKTADLALAEEDYHDAFSEYRYLLDFYSSECDYRAIIDRLYQVAGLMREAGKVWCFIRFDNPVEVRRAYEATVLRAPGAEFTPKALLIIADLRCECGENEEAIAVYENLINLYSDCEEVRSARRLAGGLRMELLRRYDYNRARTRDTIGYLKSAMRGNLDAEDRPQFAKWLAEAEELLAGEAWEAAKFYDSPTRTRASAIAAYENFLREHPVGEHADLARTRLAELKGENKE